MELRQFYNLFIMMPHENFRDFIDPENEVGRLLQAHFVALQLIMTPITNSERVSRKVPDDPEEKNKSVGWLLGLHANIPPRLLKYYEWTMWIEDQVRNGKLYNGVV